MLAKRDSLSLVSKTPESFAHAPIREEMKSKVKNKGRIFSLSNFRDSCVYERMRLRLDVWRERQKARPNPITSTSLREEGQKASPDRGPRPL